MRPGTRTFLSIILVFFTVWLSARLLLPLFSPFLLGLFLALAAEPVVRLLTRVHVPRAISAGIGVLMAFFLMAMVILILCALLIRELGVLAGVLPDMEQTARSGISLVQNWLIQLSSHMPQSVQPLLRDNVTALFSDGAALLGRFTGYLLGLAGSLLSHVPDSALSLGTAVIAGCMISAKLPRIRQWVLRRIPKQRLRSILRTWRRVKGTLAAWLLAQCKLIGVTALLLFLGFVLLKVPYALLWALAVCLVDALPVLGTGTVLLPWSLVLFLQDDIPRAIGFLGLYATISLTRSILEPKLLGRHLGLDPLVTLIALYAGYKLWGITGMIFAPLLTVTAIQLAPGKMEA